MSNVIKAGSVNFDELNVKKIDVPDYSELLFEREEKNGIDCYSNSNKIDSESAELKAANILDEARREAQIVFEDAQKQAAVIVAGAKNEADTIINDAEKAKVEISEKAKIDGYDKGYGEGVAAGTEKAGKLISEAEDVLSDACDKRFQMISNAEREMLDIISKVSKKLLNREVKTDPSIIVALIQQGFDEATMVGDIKIHVSKEDYDFTMDHIDEVMSQAKSGAHIEVLKDLSLTKNDCVIETPYGNIDCSFGQQFDSLVENLYLLLENSTTGE